MPRIAANLSLLFTERPFLERFAAAGAAGFQGVEFLFPYDWPMAAVKAALDDNGLEPVLFNLPAGDWGAGERGLAGLPGREAAFRDGLERALDYAEALDCPRLHAMAGIPGDDMDRARARDTLIANLAFAAERCAERGRVLTLEPINSRLDMPGYLIDTPASALAVIRAVDRPSLRLQYDLYHARVMGEDLFASLAACMPWIEHVQFADCPGRHQPGTGTLPLAALLAHLDALGYGGWASAEYRPSGATEEGLDWLANLRQDSESLSVNDKGERR
ncbi:hydroxypyruvate isomerase family protein [Alloalcanivorax sp. C16-2]|uniref:hydroxypyruvate isomerase family protein n=1 Tax=Alloalcanivorax TaxID=3020832 RepID=UPI00193160AA|nr:TIM barrel protein [Alloalcanivorax marinus]MBL7249554.1 TIM barrel protein [Alloalcanivorax marinus]